VDLSTLPVVHADQISARHIDRFGHVNVMWYTHFFDEGTLGLFERLGCGPSYHATSGHGTFALEQHARYLRELREGERIELRARLLGASPKRIHFMLFLSAGPELSATSELLGMHVHLGTRRSAALPPAVSLAARGLLAVHRELAWTAQGCGSISA
jgi:acyl-CoA thioester hydrolase